MGGGPGGPDAHFHRTISESFFVLSGTVKLFDDGRDWNDSHPGDFVYVPEGGLHGFRNESGEPASMLILFAPGAPREAYFEGLVELAEGRWQPSHQELQAFMVEHDNIFV
jgi:mannose-6-phosphate isomerase-like protein (cupin superfamily)